MSTHYKPPFARMRQIKQNAGPPMSKDPVSVLDAITQMTEPPHPLEETVFVVEEPEALIEDPLTPVEVLPVPMDAPPVEEPEPVAKVMDLPPPLPATPKKPDLTKMNKTELAIIAANKGIPISDEMTKAQIVAAIRSAE